MRKTLQYRLLVALLLMGWGQQARAEKPVAPILPLAETEVSDPIETVLIRPIFDQGFACVEHWAGQMPSLGDALGTDCMIQALVEERGRLWMRAHRGEGRQNEDWFGWKKTVYAPVTGKVIKVNRNRRVNLPGITGNGPASFIVIVTADDVHVLVAHVREVKVQTGDEVTAGQAIAQVGNNGFSRHPHIHLGAWKGKQPLQIRFDQRYMKPQKGNEVIQVGDTK